MNKYRKGSIEAKLDQLLPDWQTFRVVFHELWREPEGGWSVNDSWCVNRAADRETAIADVVSRWRIFKVNYLPTARVRDIEDAGCDEDCLLEVDCTALATLTRGEA